jgi:hypothetical protein
LGRVLVIAIGVDNDVGSKFKAFFEAVGEGGGQTQIASMAKDVGDLVSLRDSDSVVTAAVVDDKSFNAVDAGDLGGQRVENGR